MKTLYKFLTSIGLSLLVLAAVQPAYAAELDIDCGNASPPMCSASGLMPLFSTAADGLWYPGRTLTHTVNVQNTGTTTQDISVKATRTSTPATIEDVLNLSIVPTGGGPVIWA